MRIIGVDHTGAEPILVVDFGNGEETVVDGPPEGGGDGRSGAA